MAKYGIVNYLIKLANVNWSGIKTLEVSAKIYLISDTNINKQETEVEMGTYFGKHMIIC